MRSWIEARGPSGAVVGSKKLTEEVFKFLRTAGPTLSAFNAWVLAKGMETLKIRMAAQSANALELAAWLEAHPKVARVFYPGLESHPQHALAKRQQKSGGAILAFEVKGGKAEAWKVVDHCRLLSITANLGDVKTTITHPATTTHSQLSETEQISAGVSPDFIRLSIGIEDIDDILWDLGQALEA